MNEPKKKILKMLSEGKIDENQAEELLDAIEEKDTDNKINIVETYESSQDFEEGFKKFKEDVLKTGEHFLLIYVNSADGDNVRVKLPMSFVKIVIDASKDEKVNFNGVDVDVETIKKAIDSGSLGRIVEVDSNDGDKVIVEMV